LLEAATMKALEQQSIQLRMALYCGGMVALVAAAAVMLDAPMLVAMVSLRDAVEGAPTGRLEHPAASVWWTECRW
jgi:hypothetical protein